MSDPFDIFRTESDGKVLWLETAESMDRAKERIHELAAHLPGAYVILNHQTGERVVLKPRVGSGTWASKKGNQGGTHV